jgi:mono/diheme cytochrome c family protein
MEWLFIVVPFLALGIGVIFVAFSGGPGAARQAYLTRGGRAFTIAIVLLYIACGIAVPAVVIASRGESEGAVGSLRTAELTDEQEEGKVLFVATCKSCHTLAAVNAQGVTGPNLDELGGLDKQRVLNAIRRGGTGDGRMPANLLSGSDAEAVATYVAAVAGQ